MRSTSFFIGQCALLVLAACTDVARPRTPLPARITHFIASSTETKPGVPVQLSFTTVDATAVWLIDDHGNELAIEGDASAGRATVSPERSTFYVLNAVGPDGGDAAFVQVSVQELPRDVYLLAVPDEVEAGHSAQLIWSAAGADEVTLKTATTQLRLPGARGVLTVTPTRSERYELSAGPAGYSAATEVRVRPKLLTFTLDAPNGLTAGTPVTLRWTSRGAQQLVLRETTFGRLTEVSDDGAFDWTVPTTLPNGAPVQTGVPLRFELLASSNAGTDVRNVTAVVGDVPLIERVTAPAAATSGGHFTLSWNTLNASKVAIELDGQRLFETQTSERARAEAGSVSLPSPAGETNYTLIASNDRDVSARSVVTVRPTPIATIDAFTVTPSLVQWRTTNAQRVQLRVANGPTIAVNDTTPAQGSFTFRVASAQTLVLEAINAAGDITSSTKRFEPGTAPVVQLSPSPTIVGDTITLNWALASLGVTDVAGLPTPRPPKLANSPHFANLTDPTTLLFADRADGTAELPLPAGFHFMLLGVERPKLWVSVNGFVTFENVAVSNVNRPLVDTPAMLAPYWDDLALSGSSHVLAGFGPPLPSGERRYVIQWDKVVGAGDELTFQLQLTESGAVTFVYGDMSGQTGSAATIGVHDPLQGVSQEVTTPIASNDELRFFSGAAPDASFQFIARTSRLITFVGRTATEVIPFVVPLVALDRGSLRITEAMPSPEASVSFGGQWVELHNTMNVDVELSGVKLRSNSSNPDGGFVADGVVIPAKGYVVLGASTDPVENGGANVTVVMSDVPLDPGADTLRLSLLQTELDSLSWTTSIVGRSIQQSSGVLVGGDLASRAPLCTRGVRTFGPDGAIGTPGAENEACPPYVMSRIAGAYVELGTQTGDVELLSTVNSYRGFGDVQLPAPFTYFGQAFDTLSLSLSGFVTFGSPLLQAHEVMNDVRPDTTAPNGVVAPFWDRLIRNFSGHVWLRRTTNRTIISWQDFRAWGLSASNVNFQVHLFDSGVIEFHYGAMSITGPSATVWLEAPSGGHAVSAGVNTEGTVASNSGIRFTP